MTVLLLLVLLLGGVALLPPHPDAKGRCTEWDDEEQAEALRRARPGSE